MKPDDSDYYRDRAIQEQVAARRATCEAARERHEELAMMYRFRASMLATHPSSWVDQLNEPASAE